MGTRHYGYTDIGRVRSRNEDAFLADAHLGLFIVCDGVGGRARGEIASQETVEFIIDFVKGDATDIEIARIGGGVDSAARQRASPAWCAGRSRAPATWSTPWARWTLTEGACRPPPRWYWSPA